MGVTIVKEAGRHPNAPNSIYIHTCIMCMSIYRAIDRSIYLSIYLSLSSKSDPLFIQFHHGQTLSTILPPNFEYIGGQRLRYVVLLPRHTTQALLWWNRFRFCWAQKSAGGMSLSGGRCIWHWLRLAMVCWVTKVPGVAGQTVPIPEMRSIQGPGSKSCLSLFKSQLLQWHKPAF